jgi:Gly-Xaa carboxypeptidase
MINTWGLVFTWNGSDKDLKPSLKRFWKLLILVLFMAHQDVVPADGGGDWKYPPWSGHFDGERVWGRGTSLSELE